MGSNITGQMHDSVQSEMSHFVGGWANTGVSRKELRETKRAVKEAAREAAEEQREAAKAVKEANKSAKAKKNDSKGTSKGISKGLFSRSQKEPASSAESYKKSEVPAIKEPESKGSNFFKNLLEWIETTITGDVDFALRFTHILFAVVVYFFFSGNTLQVPITMLTYLGVIIIVGYFLGQITEVTKNYTKITKYLCTGISFILVLTWIIMAAVDSENLGGKLFYDIFSHDVMVWWLLFILSIMYWGFGYGGGMWPFDKWTPVEIDDTPVPGSGFMNSIHIWVDETLNGNGVTLVKIFLVLIGITFSVYNNLRANCNDQNNSPSGGQKTFLIVFMIIYSVFVILFDIGMLVLNFYKPGKLKIYRDICKWEEAYA